jgi:hypothetical protein
MWLHYGNRRSDRAIKGTSPHAASTPRDTGARPLVGLDLAIAFGPLRFDYAVPPGKGKYDVVQQLKFCGGTSFRSTGGAAMLIAGCDRLCNRGKATEASYSNPANAAGGAGWRMACQF